MPFGVRNAPAVIQTLMDEVLEGKKAYARAYMDDVIIFSGSWEEHILYVREVLAALRSPGLMAYPSKSVDGTLGHPVGKGKTQYLVTLAETKANYTQLKTEGHSLEWFPNIGNF